MLEQLHIASQYLAAFGINYIDPKPDDSHTNLDWEASKSRLVSRATDQAIQLSLDYESFSLSGLKSGDVTDQLLLDGKSHSEVLTWLNKFSEANQLGKPMKYELHYELPYPPISGDYTFELKSTEELNQLADQLTRAKTGFEKFLAINKLSSEIRVWPHHFDLGIYAQLGDQLFLGGGLAVPDSMSASLYYYTSGWKNGETVDTSNFKELSAGKWMSPEWNGGLLSSSVGQDHDQIVSFLNESYAEFVKGA